MINDNFLNEKLIDYKVIYFQFESILCLASSVASKTIGVKPQHWPRFKSSANKTRDPALNVTILIGMHFRAGDILI